MKLNPTATPTRRMSREEWEKIQENKQAAADMRSAAVQSLREKLIADGILIPKD